MPKINLTELKRRDGGGDDDGRLPDGVMALDPAAREALLLHVALGMTTAQIARVTSLPAEHVSTLIAEHEHFLREGSGANFGSSQEALARARRIVATAAAMDGAARAALERAAQTPGLVPPPALAGCLPDPSVRLCVRVARAVAAAWPSAATRERLREFWAEFAAGSVWMFSRQAVATTLVVGLIMGAGTLTRRGVEALALSGAQPLTAVASGMTTRPPALVIEAAPSGHIGLLIRRIRPMMEVVQVSETINQRPSGPVILREYLVFNRKTLTYEVRRVERVGIGPPLSSVFQPLLSKGPAAAPN